ncbi:MAG: M23 family metallopeptidase [Cyanobacteria bacterium J06636_27]
MVLLKSKLFVSALIALPLSVFSVKALTPTLKSTGTSPLGVKKNVQTKVVKSEHTIRPKKKNPTSKTIKIAHHTRRSGWRIPWLGATAVVTQRWHSDSWGRYKSVDFGLPAGTPVVAPIASRVLSFCNAGRNHLAIRLQASDGNRYSLVHVKSRSVYVGKRYRRGQVIGTIARNTPRNRCARSTGPHLHMSFPRQNFRLGRYWFSRSYIPKRLKP